MSERGTTNNMSKAIENVLEERQRQIEDEGWTEEHDDQHDDRSLALAGACYAKHYAGRSWIFDNFGGPNRYREDEAPEDWPDSWDEKWWKPKSPRRDLVRAAALLIAEIERLVRMDSTCSTGNKGGSPCEHLWSDPNEVGVKECLFCGATTMEEFEEDD